jgi:hypothetical protein
MLPNFKVSPNLIYFKKLTTKIGILQHGKLDKPDPSFGYSIDDCARALIVAYQLFETYNDKSVLQLTDIYLDYLVKSKIKGSYFHNFADKNEVYLDEVGSETSSGRAIWALGYIASRKNINEEASEIASKILQDLPATSRLVHIRSKAYALIGRCYLKDKAKVNLLASSLVRSFNEHEKENWFEDHLEYANAILPFSLFLAFALTNNKEYLEVAGKSYLFLDKLTRKENFVCPISSVGWKIGSGNIETYDQQAIEAADMVLAARAGFLSTGNPSYKKSAEDWFAWFWGNNIHKVNMIDEKTGACFDGITKDGVNKNQGAESILCYLLAYLAVANQNVLK